VPRSQLAALFRFSQIFGSEPQATATKERQAVKEAEAHFEYSMVHPSSFIFPLSLLFGVR